MSAAEIARGWVEFSCPRHGFLVAATWKAAVSCRCGRRAQRVLDGAAWRLRDLERRDRWRRT